MSKLTPELALSRLAAKLQLGVVESVKRVSPSLAAGVLQTGCKALVCRRVAPGEFVLLFSGRGLSRRQRGQLQNAGFIIS
jgi:hypothetical protein